MRGFSLGPIRPGEVEAVRRLVQLYIYDLGGAQWDVQPNGMFAPPDWHRLLRRFPGRWELAELS